MRAAAFSKSLQLVENCMEHIGLCRRKSLRSGLIGQV
jgi:hypothetical protein